MRRSPWARVRWAGRIIGFAGLADYPQLLRVLADGEQGRGYSLVSAGLALGLGPGVARAAAVPWEPA